jgi:glycosyltransferase involved in cell wall biosynthesis
MREPTLLFVATVARTIGGFLTPYALHFRGRGWRVEAAANGVVRNDDANAAFDRVHEIPLSRSIADLRGMARSVAAVRAIVRRSRPDIVHVHTPIAAFVTRLAVRTIAHDERPLIAYTAHGFHFHRAGHRATNVVFRIAESIAGRWTDRLIVINDEDEAAATRHRIVRRGALVRMRGIGIDTTRYSPEAVAPHQRVMALTKMGARPDTPLFVVVGELNRNKRPFDAVEALSRMEHRDAQLVLLGDGPLRPAVERRSREDDIAGRVFLPGRVADVRPVVAGAIALVAPSSREGLSRSVMEALALTVPVVASTARGNAELVGDSGFIVETGDVLAIAHAMDWLADHPEDGRAMGARGRARIVDRYDLASLIAAHEALYAAMLRLRP